uniref:Uncharacterized protein n=1 Tax=Mycena chlorophos TaxID=658473 RepID=A0ABQ0LIU2_MYCCL|nr:predicted protein [Mycena chlorophos]
MTPRSFTEPKDATRAVLDRPLGQFLRLAPPTLRLDPSPRIQVAVRASTNSVLSVSIPNIGRSHPAPHRSSASIRWRRLESGASSLRPIRRKPFAPPFLRFGSRQHAPYLIPSPIRLHRPHPKYQSCGSGVPTPGPRPRPRHRRSESCASRTSTAVVPWPMDVIGTAVAHYGAVLANVKVVERRPPIALQLAGIRRSLLARLGLSLPLQCTGVVGLPVLHHHHHHHHHNHYNLSFALILSVTQCPVLPLWHHHLQWSWTNKTHYRRHGTSDHQVECRRRLRSQKHRSIRDLEPNDGRYLVAAADSERQECQVGRVAVLSRPTQLAVLTHMHTRLRRHSYSRAMSPPCRIRLACAMLVRGSLVETRTALVVAGGPRGGGPAHTNSGTYC